MVAPNADTIVLGGLNSIEGKVMPIPTHQAINERISFNEKRRLAGHEDDDSDGKKDGTLTEIKEAPPVFDGSEPDKDDDDYISK